MAPVTKIIGTKAMLWAIAALTDIDITVAETPGDHQRYDFLIILDDGTYRRVQAKHARIMEGKLLFNACSNSTTTEENSSDPKKGKTIKIGYSGQADFFAAYNESTGTSYLIPVNAVGNVSASGPRILRLQPTIKK